MSVHYYTYTITPNKRICVRCPACGILVNSQQSLINFSSFMEEVWYQCNSCLVVNKIVMVRSKYACKL